MGQVRERLVALDVLRGLAVAGMIMVVSPGDWGAAYAQLQHAEWDGWTLADMVFPTFLFSVGAALALSFPRPWRTAEERRSFWTRAVRRTLLLIVLGLALEATYNLALRYTGGTLGRTSLAHLRIPGILQRIALCYLLATALLLTTSEQDKAGRRTLRAPMIALVAAVILAGYWIVLALVPTPGYGAGRLDAEGYLGGYIDRMIFTVPHLWPLGWATPGGPVFYDPEGLLSTVPATVNVLIGALAGAAWQRRGCGAAWLLATLGAALVLAGLLFDPLFPINKRIWSSSFALFSSGFSAVLLAGLIAVERRRLAAVLLTPMRVLGGNAILAFVAATLLGRVYDLPIMPAAGGTLSPRAWLNGQALALLGDRQLAATACAALFVVVVVLLLLPLHRRAFHFRL